MKVWQPIITNNRQFSLQEFYWNSGNIRNALQIDQMLDDVQQHQNIEMENYQVCGLSISALQILIHVSIFIICWWTRGGQANCLKIYCSRVYAWIAVYEWNSFVSLVKMHLRIRSLVCSLRIKMEDEKDLYRFIYLTRFLLLRLRGT